MDAQRIEDVTEWDSRRFSDGFADLRRLADRGFSGAATDGSGWLLFLNGRIVGIVDTELEAFAEASGTAYHAPDESLPLLFAMQEVGGTKRAQYYTNDTSLTEADRTLSAGGFTGYVELSENVLSGDYYVTYTGGESRAVAFVGNARRVETGADAFELADDEIGIYTVYEVDLDVQEVPKPTAKSGADDRPADGPDGTSGELDEAAPEPEADDSTTPTSTPDPGRTDDAAPAETGTTEAQGAGSEASEAETEPAEGATTSVEASTNPAGMRAEDGPSGDGEDSDAAAADADSQGADLDAKATDTSVAAADQDAHTVATEPATAETTPDVDGAKPASAAEAVATPPAEPRTDEQDSGSGDDDVFSEEAQWREATSIPALDPQDASPAPDTKPDSRRAHRDRNARTENESGGPRRRRSGSTPEQGSPDPRSGNGGGRAAVSRRTTEDERIAELESALERAEAEREALSTERDAVAADRDEHKAERERLEAEVESLRAERDRLRDQLDEARANLPDAERTVPAAQARSETNLFIRYRSKGAETLADAHEGEIDRDALRENLRIEHHTSFESEDVTVDGLPYREFLEGTMEYGFIRWLVEELMFEIRDTDNESALRDLYDALPEVDRAEIDGSVSMRLTEGGEETREQRTFDLVLRDRMGNPLFIADLNDSRAPTGGGTLESLISNGRDVSESNDSFAAAFAVTASFFEPDALEAAGDAVGGGLFGTKRRSFVKLSRKQGYHLCLAESRDGGFHLAMPDL
ncbi:DUF7527 domain-containing protein [Halorubrum vacuolatum]|uniref:DUF7527 domain-containing protein n=1 Tax=Halorubrum vacuolatum TaxID=63740 RepID=A0A238VDS6_HALVU|nr:hypothetical protein [Halorubrum vacuolatum]SNR32308.1 hypothetical protein SAMN06264855_102297 [Halorubrum vacuolatum]